jgi:hypothetical protein
VGAPVKVQGVQVGLVKEIGLQLDLDKQRLTKPVVLEIDPLRLTTPEGLPLKLSCFSSGEIREELKHLIESAGGARLELPEHPDRALVCRPQFLSLSARAADRPRVAAACPGAFHTADGG